MDRKDIDWDKIHSKEHKDFYGEDIKVGDRLLKPSYEYGIAVFDHCIVTRIENGKIYLDNSKNPIKFPRRCVNISKLRTMDH